MLSDIKKNISHSLIWKDNIYQEVDIVYSLFCIKVVNIQKQKDQLKF